MCSNQWCFVFVHDVAGVPLLFQLSLVLLSGLLLVCSYRCFVPGAPAMTRASAVADFPTAVEVFSSSGISNVSGGPCCCWPPCSCWLPWCCCLPAVFLAVADVPLPRTRVCAPGSPNSDDWRKSLALCLLWGLRNPTIGLSIIGTKKTIDVQLWCNNSVEGHSGRVSWRWAGFFFSNYLLSCTPPPALLKSPFLYMRLKAV